MTYNRYEPANGPSYAGLGAAVKQALRPDVPVIGPDTEGLSPGFHKQSNGMMMYVPDMAVIDAKTQVKRVGLRPGFYALRDRGDGPGEVWMRYYDGRHWGQTCGCVSGSSYCDAGVTRAEKMRCTGELDCRVELVYGFLGDYTYAQAHALTTQDWQDLATGCMELLEGDPPQTYDEPEGDSPEDVDLPLDLQDDETRPVGFYTVNTMEQGDAWVRYWTGEVWHMTGCEDHEVFNAPRLVHTIRNKDKGCPVYAVLYARPDLDAMVLK